MSLRKALCDGKPYCDVNSLSQLLHDVQVSFLRLHDKHYDDTKVRFASNEPGSYSREQWRPIVKGLTISLYSSNKKPVDSSVRRSMTNSTLSCPPDDSLSAHFHHEFALSQEMN